jgi:hypothetical protein
LTSKLTVPPLTVVPELVVSLTVAVTVATFPGEVVNTVALPETLVDVLSADEGVK